MLTMQVMACMGIIIGLFLLLGINLTDFTGNIFKRLLDGPKGIREEILEQTQRKKKSFLRREVEEIQSILKATDRENTFPFLCTVSLVLFAVGAAGAAMLGNFFLVPVAAVPYVDAHGSGADNAQHCRHYYFCIHSPCNQTDKTDRIQVVERRQYESDIILCVFDLFYRSLSAACRTITSADLKDQQGNDGYR